MPTLPLHYTNTYTDPNPNLNPSTNPNLNPSTNPNLNPNRLGMRSISEAATRHSGSSMPSMREARARQEAL